MQIAFLAHRIPYPPDKGDKIRAFHELRGLIERGHAVHLLAFVDDRRDLRHLAQIREHCSTLRFVRLGAARAAARALGGLFTPVPLSIGYFRSRVMARQVRAVLDRHRVDAIVAFSSAMAQYVPASMAARTIVDLVDVDSEKWREYSDASRGASAWLYRTEARRLRRYEESIVERFGHAVVTTDRERQLLRPRGAASARLSVVGNGVDLDYFRPGCHGRLEERVPVEERRRCPQGANPLLVFTGVMNYRPNVDAVCYFVREVLPLVRLSEPLAELLIVGRDPSVVVRRLAAVAGVTVTGAVADVRPYLAAARLAVIPLRIARGIQNKVLEALAAGCPVVATPESVAGLAIEAGTHALVAASPDDMARAVVTLIRDDSLRRRLQSAGRAFVEQRHQWAPLLRSFSELVEGVVPRAVPA